MGGQMPPQLEALPPHLPPQSEWDFFFFFTFFYFFFTYVVSHTNLKLISAFSAISVSINKVIHRRSIVYNIQWCGIIYVCTYTRVTHTESLVRESLIRPLDPRQGLCPCTPPGALRRAPGPHPKSARAYALAMCAPRTCLPPQKNRLALTRSLCALRAHVCPKKIGPQQFKKIGSRFALAMCATRTCLPPHNQSLPPSCPPTFKILVPPLGLPRAMDPYGPLIPTDP